MKNEIHTKKGNSLEMIEKKRKEDKIEIQTEENSQKFIKFAYHFS
jgi:hypothetical protein